MFVKVIQIFFSILKNFFIFFCYFEYLLASLDNLTNFNYICEQFISFLFFVNLSGLKNIFRQYQTLVTILSKLNLKGTKPDPIFSKTRIRLMSIIIPKIQKSKSTEPKRTDPECPCLLYSLLVACPRYAQGGFLLCL